MKTFGSGNQSEEAVTEVVSVLRLHLSPFYFLAVISSSHIIILKFLTFSLPNTTYQHFHYGPWSHDSLPTTSTHLMLCFGGIFQCFHSQPPLSVEVLVPGVGSNFFSSARISSLPSFSCDTWHIPLDCLISSLRARLNGRVGKHD